MKNIAVLVVSLGVCQLAALIGSLFNARSIPEWYDTLNKPFFNPPSWVFAPVWTALFVLMGISLYIVWAKGWKKKEVRTGIALFGVQLVLNVLWSFFFFYLRSPLFGLIGIIVLWIAILLTIIWFARVSRTAACLLVPYIVWVSFAAVLNLSFVLLN